MQRIMIVTALAAAFALAAPGLARAQQPGNLIAKGAQVYANQCGRCHNLRSPTERSDAQWSVIVAHMRARANLTRDEAEAVEAFLQGTNVDTGSAGAVGSLPPAGEVVALLRQIEERNVE